MKKPVKTPANRKVLAKYVDAYAREHGTDVARVRRWISFMALAGALQEAALSDGRPKFVIKGGVALELRLRDRARATKDIDVILDSDDGDLLDEIEDALTTRYEGFAFRRKGEEHRMPNGTIRMKVQVAYRGREWGTVDVDVAHREGETEVDLLEGLDLMQNFGIRGPEGIRSLSLRHHVAQKIHAATQPPPEGRSNERFRDVVDLLLMCEVVTDYAALREACVEVFRRRGTHDWPPVLDPTEEWRDAFLRMAREIDLAIADLDEALGALRSFVERIASA